MCAGTQTNILASCMLLFLAIYLQSLSRQLSIGMKYIRCALRCGQQFAIRGHTLNEAAGLSETKPTLRRLLTVARKCRKLLMKTNQWQSKIGGAILAISFVFGIAVLSVRALAQNPDDRNSQDRNRSDNGDANRRGRNWDRYGNYGGSSELRQTALNAGYNEGIKDGRRDRMTGRHSRYEDSNAYRRATKDYSSRVGDRELYRRYFREGYENGYSAESYARDNRNGDYGDNRNRNRDNGDRNRSGRGSDGYSNFGGSFQLRQTALNAGFNEGVKQGRTDRKNQNGRGYQGQSTYQNATKDYSSPLGDREVYQRYFREAYEHGYEDGISGN
jgi:hypothetical protein